MEITKSGKHSWIGDYGYLGVIALLLILRVFFWFSPTHAEKMNTIYLWPLMIASLALVFYARRQRLPEGSALTAGMAAWLFVSAVLGGDPYLELNRTFMLGIVVCFIGCYWVIPTLPAKRRETGLRILSGLYVALMLAIALLGVYAAVSGMSIRTPFSDAAIGVLDARLYVFHYHPNEIGAAFVIALYLLIYFALSTHRVWLKIIYALAGLALYVAISLTVSRTSMMLAAAGCGVCAFWLAYRAFAKRKALLRWAVGGLLLVLVTGIVYLGCIQTIQLVGIVSQKARAAASAPSAAVTVAPDGVAASDVAADAASVTPQATPAAAPKAAPVVRIDESRQNISDIGTFNMRTQLWEAGFAYLRQHPLALLLGAPDNVVSRIPATVGRKEYHLHNVMVEMLLLGGVPGLLMYLAFLYVLARRALRLAFAKVSPLAHRFLAVVPILLVVNGLTEIYPMFSGNVMDMMSFAIATG
ncbi:MAG TPA: O-antigen ligase family protein, partial [Candidatus Limiplasma sp.]|nr:O-antigen ligase family protein [Candidatus Limiplasma sp.]